MLRLVSYQLKTASSHTRGALPQVGLFLPKEESKKTPTSETGNIVNLLEIPTLASIIRDQGLQSRWDMNCMIENHQLLVPPLLKSLQEGKLPAGIARSDAKLLSPIPIPRRNVMCVGKNYRDHIAEVAKADKAHGIGTTSNPSPELPKYPQFFTKASNCVIGIEEQIESHHQITKWLDYEAELAVIIGKKGRDLTPETVQDHIFGFTVANDVTARDIQRHHGQWFKGKSLDAICPLGPWIVYNNSTFNAQSLGIRLWVNEEKRQESNTSNMIFTISDILCQLSKGMTLYPGDIILTGTPDGVGYAMKPPKVLSRGDRVRIEIDQIGILENIVN